MSAIPHVVIVGAGFGGLKAAKALARAPVRVTVIDRNNYHLFQPLLYQVATAGLSPANIASPVRSVLRNQSNTEVIMGEVRGVDTQAKTVLLADRAIAYDYLVLATGAGHSYFGRDDWAANAPGLKTVEDATAIRRKILLAFEAAEVETDPVKRAGLLTFVVVGGGATGVEMAGSIADLAHRALTRDFRHIDPKSARILLVEAGPRLLAAFPDELASKAQRSLEKLGVEVRVQQRVQDVNEQGVVIDDKLIASSCVIWAAGVVASKAGAWLGAECDRAGRVKVNPDLTVPGHTDVYVVGDTAAVPTKDGKILPGVAPVAMQAGRYVGQSIKKRLRGESVAPFRYIDKGNLATIGRSSAIADIHGLKLSGFVAWVTWLLVHIVYIIGFRNRLLVLIQWAWAYFMFQPGARLITLEQPEREEYTKKMKTLSAL